MKKDKIIKEFIVAIYPTLNKECKTALIDAITAGAKLTKADAGRMLASLPKKEFSDFICGSDKAGLIDAISDGAKLTKADAGRALDGTIEAIQKKLKTVFGGKGQ